MEHHLAAQDLIRVSLPDGSVRHYDRPVSGAEIAADIGAGLAKAALAIRIDGVMKDLATVIGHDARVAVVTAKDEDALELLRHDAAHVMAEAVQELYPDTQVTIGPAIENGFYYDFARKQPFTPEDLETIEARMREIVDRREPIVREVWPREQAIAYFKSIGEHYKAEIIAEIPEGEEISIYRQGQWLDLCTGPHLPSTAHLGKAFKLMKVAGAYWRGDESRQMLSRIYGTAFFSKGDLAEHEQLLEEARARDHRRLGPELDLFMLRPESPGMPFWLPEGTVLLRLIRDEVDEPGTGLVCFGTFAFADEPGGSMLVVPEVIVGRRGDRTWLTTVSRGALDALIVDAGHHPDHVLFGRALRGYQPAPGACAANGAGVPVEQAQRVRAGPGEVDVHRVELLDGGHQRGVGRLHDAAFGHLGASDAAGDGRGHVGEPEADARRLQRRARRCWSDGTGGTSMPTFERHSTAGTDRIAFEPTDLIMAGWTGRDRAAVAAGADVVLACNDRTAAEAILDGLRVPADPVSRARLAALHAREGAGFPELTCSPAWQDARRLVLEELDRTG